MSILHSPRAYDTMVSALMMGGERRMREAVLDLGGVGPGARVLDVGCGTGTQALHAKQRGAATVAALDASPEMIEHARAKAARAGLDVDFRVCSADALPFDGASFDAVLCTMALHHLRRDARTRAAAEMHRVLVPGGRVVAVEIVPESGLASLNLLSMLHRRAGDMAAQAASLFEGAGFSNVEIGRIGVRGLRYILGRK